MGNQLCNKQRNLVMTKLKAILPFSRLFLKASHLRLSKSWDCELIWTSLNLSYVAKS